mmetsp:Transcript_67462/g.140979  ORF Transcript_67462/g.140979 Transcript_67462/m.140979 type:complete len:577 (+) Transcript_67462:181-1911(+)
MEPGDDATEKIQKLEVELDGVKEKLKKTAAQNIQAQSKAKKKTEECEKLHQEKAELKEKLQKQAAQNVRLKSKVHTLEQAQINAAVAGAGATPASFSMGNEELAMELEKAKVTIENLDRECRFLTGKVQEAGRMGQTLLDSNVELQKKLDAITKERSETSAVKNNASDSIRTLEEMVRALEQENEDLRNNGVSKMASKRPQLERGITDALEQNDQLCATLSRMENENVMLKIQIEKLESSVPDRDDDDSAKVSDSVGPKVSAIKTAFQGAMGKVKQDRLHRLLEEEEERSRDLQIELTNMKKDQGGKDMEVMKMRTAFHDLESYARKQEQEARAAQLSAQNLQLRLDGLEQTMKKMNVSGTADDHDERMKQIKMAGDIAGTMLQDLKDGLDDSIIDDLNFLTADSSDDDPDSEDDDDYEKSLAALEEQRAREGAANAGSSTKGPARLKPNGPGAGEIVATVSAPGASSAPPPKNQKKLKEGKSIALTRTEKEVVKMTLNDTHKKLLQAMRLVELLKNANDKLQSELDFIEQRAVKKIKCLHNTTVGIVVCVSTVLICGFFFFVIEKVNCPSEKGNR